jgi:hypothetical protein
MLQLVEHRGDKAKAQRLLASALTKEWRLKERRTIVWRPGRREVVVRHNGRLWWASNELGEAGTETPRYFNFFGTFQHAGTLQISVEINIPTTENTRRVAGFFARDAEADEILLMHDGAVGGGRPGIGRNEYLQFASAKPLPVLDRAGDVRPGLVIARIAQRRSDTSSTVKALARFIGSVVDFKAISRDGGTAGEGSQTYKDYYDEAFGPRRRQRTDEIEYISRHGQIVKALQSWRARKQTHNESIVKNALIDLGIRREGALVELYEVKPTCERQALYTAIGQLVVHSADNQSVARYLAIPKDGRVPDDIKRSLAVANVKTLNFEIRDDEVSIL